MRCPTSNAHYFRQQFRASLSFFRFFRLSPITHESFPFHPALGGAAAGEGREERGFIVEFSSLTKFFFLLL